MDGTIHLDNQPFLPAEEVDDETTDRLLPAKPHPGNPVVSELPPKTSLRFGRSTTEPTGAFLQDVPKRSSG